ncbi:hypothetical protein A6A06_24855 [Streptomyces sp. CB02923]|uniref:hypothetical protein n=1 Tax=Streptomyces sp. CB02923 TaxID=1718985 RepID=UPI00093E36D4|nr:hypothetical protein [Streptomyces sp. CB02923]OKH98855.1 hypothetical protein A6A06_24855 [Streptomyces sp. CB02923]
MILLQKSGTALAGRLLYSESEYSFRYAVADRTDMTGRVGPDGVASLSIGTLQIEVGVATRQLLFVWGLHPRQKWQTSPLTPPDAGPGRLTVAPQEGGFTAGEARALDPGMSWLDAWPTWFDPDSGWVRTAADESPDDDLTQIADGVVAGRIAERLHSLWLKPEFIA